LTEAGIWLVVLLAGVALLGVMEAVRPGKFSGPCWETARFAVVAAALFLLTVISGVLAVTWVIGVLIWEIWEALLVALYFRRRSV